MTVKIRRGFDERHVNAVEIAKIIEDCGAAAVAVHGRTREQYYAGHADWDIIRQVKEAVSIPVIGNGDVVSAQTAAQMFAQTGCDGIMVARGARGNPWIFRELVAWYRGEPIPAAPGMDEVRQMLLRQAELLVKYKGEYTAIREMRKHVAWYTAGFPHSSKLRARVNEINTMEDLVRLMNEWE